MARPTDLTPGTVPRRGEVLRAAGRAVLYGLVTAVFVLALAVLLSGPSQRERRQTSRNVALLVEEARKNRTALCIAVVRNPANAASSDQEMLDLCGEVGVEP